MILLVVFDFDGTLVDSNHIKEACLHRTVAGLAGGAKALMAARTLGDRYSIFAEVARRLGPRRDPDEVVEEARRLVAQYSECCARGIAAAPLRRGARSVLRALKSRGKRVYVNSATPVRHLYQSLRQRDLIRFLDGAFGGHSEKIRNLRRILTTERVQPREALLVGDGPDDIAAARTIGTWFVAITAENRIAERVAYSMPDLTRLVALIDRLAPRPSRKHVGT